MEDFADPTGISGYHAHVYYAPATKPVAAKLREAVGQKFDVRVGSWHDEPVGPHSVAMYQLAFAADQFPRLVPWLMLNRDGLDILVHPMTGDSLSDHTRFALWLGTPLPLRLEVLRRAS